MSGLKDDVVAEILVATWKSASWKASVKEGMGWGGTAEENTEKYISSVGVEEL